MGEFFNTIYNALYNWIQSDGAVLEFAITITTTVISILALWWHMRSTFR